ncbi:hypothetical protein AV530_009983 [Patagioenas fasciata monilis]|nr:hypothetical protein AV530_009983 [Patagioenas fasciata monilis]
MVQMMQDYLEEHTGELVHGVISIIVSQCREEAQRLLQSQAAREEENSIAAGSISSSSTLSSSSYTSCTDSQEGTPNFSLASSRSSAGSDVEEQPSTLEAALHGGPGCPPSVPVPAEQEQPQEEPGQVVAAGPSAQGCSRSPSAPGQGRDRSSRGPRSPPKRRNPSPQDSPQPCKRPPHRQH